MLNISTMSEEVFNEIAKSKTVEVVELLKSMDIPNMYILCKDKIRKVENIIDKNGHLYLDFESELPYYKKYGIINEDSKEIREFNNIMNFLYLVRKSNISKLKNPYVVLDFISKNEAR